MVAMLLQTQKSTSLYQQDFVLWLQETAELLKQRKLAEIDYDNLIEEVESMGRNEKQALQSNLQIVLMHLLKYKYQPQKRSNSWRFTIIEHRDRLSMALEDSPSLRSYLAEIFEQCYAKARKKAAVETGLNIEIFSLHSPFTIDQALDLEYLPD
jgi:hypothetical protein